MALWDENSEDHWIPLADIMTGMMIIFMLVAVSFMIKVKHRESILKNRYDEIQAIKLQHAKTKEQIAHDLNMAMGNKFQAWHATFESQNLTVKFNSANVMFDTGKSKLKPEFMNNLTEFFPQYLKVVQKYAPSIASISIEGYASSGWGKLGDTESAYFLNMNLSQQRATSVLQYVYGLSSDSTTKEYIRNFFTANGYSSSHVVFNEDGSENYAKSQRVEFRIILRR
ncbi:MAG: OmpA family protein [Burkholderiales bacterium]|nr:OmpA family protein [Burkholderiales bacterium]